MSGFQKEGCKKRLGPVFEDTGSCTIRLCLRRHALGTHECSVGYRARLPALPRSEPENVSTFRHLGQLRCEVLICKGRQIHA